MKRTSTIIITSLFVILLSCSDRKAESEQIPKKENEVYAREPKDSSDYKHIKYDFYLSKSGQLCERKLAGAKGTNCNCLFKVYYDSIFKIYTEDTIIEKSLNTIVDINSFVWLDSTQYSKDKKKVFYFYPNSDGGNRTIVDKADPTTFKRFCEYRWGIDINSVFYKDYKLERLNLKLVQPLYSPDTSDHFVQYIKDDKKVFFENEIIKEADAKSFKVVSGQKWDAEDKNHKYEAGQRL